jgi:hypothetical protein
MLKRRLVPILLVVSILPGALVPAVAARGADLPDRFSPGFDGRPVYATDVSSGAIWAAWAYKSHGEFDIALSVRDLAGVLSEPTFIGRLDGLDQLTPAIVPDAAGNIYLAFAVRQSSQVFLSVLPHGAAAWSAPQAVTSPRETAVSPTLAVVANYLVIGYRTAGAKVALRSLPLIGEPIGPLGIYDSPDGTDPLAVGGTGGSGSGGSGGVGAEDGDDKSH